MREKQNLAINELLIHLIAGKKKRDLKRLFGGAAGPSFPFSPSLALRIKDNKLQLSSCSPPHSRSVASAAQASPANFKEVWDVSGTHAASISVSIGTARVCRVVFCWSSVMVSKEILGRQEGKPKKATRGGYKQKTNESRVCDLPTDPGYPRS